MSNYQIGMIIVALFILPPMWLLCYALYTEINAARDDNKRKQ